MAANIIRSFPLGCIFEDSVEGGITQTRNELLTGFTPDEFKDHSHLVVYLKIQLKAELHRQEMNF
jgi:hypothetical protein